MPGKLIRMATGAVDEPRGRGNLAQRTAHRAKMYHKTEACGTWGCYSGQLSLVSESEYNFATAIELTFLWFTCILVICYSMDHAKEAGAWQCHARASPEKFYKSYAASSKVIYRTYVRIQLCRFMLICIQILICIRIRNERLQSSANMQHTSSREWVSGLHLNLYMQLKLTPKMTALLQYINIVIAMMMMIIIIRVFLTSLEGTPL